MHFKPQNPEPRTLHNHRQHWGHTTWIKVKSEWQHKWGKQSVCYRFLPSSNCRSDTLNNLSVLTNLTIVSSILFLSQIRWGENSRKVLAQGCSVSNLKMNRSNYACVQTKNRNGTSHLHDTLIVSHDYAVGRIANFELSKIVVPHWYWPVDSRPPIVALCYHQELNCSPAASSKCLSFMLQNLEIPNKAELTSVDGVSLGHGTRFLRLQSKQILEQFGCHGRNVHGLRSHEVDYLFVYMIPVSKLKMLTCTEIFSISQEARSIQDEPNYLIFRLLEARRSTTFLFLVCSLLKA